MTIREAVELVLQASAHGVRHEDERGQIFVLDMGKPVRIVDVAKQMIRLAGLDPEKDIQIRIVGLRPGEKLFEELFDAAEKRLPEVVPGVFAALSRPIELETLRTTFGELADAAEERQESLVRQVIVGLVPGYAVRHSSADAA
jgi:O-antigen biosynthesis protein WbqV